MEPRSSKPATEVHPILHKILHELHFPVWYKELSASFQTSPPFTDFSISEVRDMIAEFGYRKTRYHEEQGIFVLEEEEESRLAGGLGAGVLLDLAGGSLELTMVFDMGISRKIEVSFSKIPALMGDKGQPPKPVFSNYKELYALLKQVLGMYASIRQRMTEIWVSRSAETSLAK